MSIAIPIISEFVDKGIKQARQEFKQLETTGAKAQFALKKAAVPATAALAGLAAGLADAAKGAIEDAEAQERLAGQLRRSTLATDDQIKANEDWISSQGKLRAYTDSELRPTIARLATVTGSLELAQEQATLAMDIATATGKPLQTVTEGLAKAYGGNLTALQKLDPGLRDVIKSGADAEEVMAMLNAQFGGAAQDAANTTAGRFKQMSIAFDETKESIGAALLPVLERMLPYLLQFSDWAQRNPALLTGVIAAVGALAAAIVAVNVAMALNPAVLVTAAIIGLGVAVVAAYKKFEGFRNVVKSVMGGVLTYFEIVANGWIKTANLIIRGMNLLKPGKDIGYIPEVSFRGDAESIARGAGVPMMANGGIVTGPTFALIGENGPEAVVPLDRLGSMGGGVTINVNGGDPQAVVDALTRWYRQNGPLPVKVA
jgi:hypothetical protein